MGLYDVDLSYYLVTADNSIYNLRHASYQFKTRTNVLNFSYFFRVAKSWNSLPLNVINKNWIFKRFLGSPEIFSAFEGYFYILWIYFF